MHGFFRLRQDEIRQYATDWSPALLTQLILSGSPCVPVFLLRRIKGINYFN